MKPKQVLYQLKNPADIELLERCKKTIQEIIPEAQVVLYGSRARGEASPASDYDILVLVNSPVSWQLERDIIERLYDLELESGQILNTQVYSLETWNSPIYSVMPFRKNVEKDSILI